MWEAVAGGCSVMHAFRPTLACTSSLYQYSEQKRLSYSPIAQPICLSVCPSVGWSVCLESVGPTVTTRLMGSGCLWDGGCVRRGWVYYPPPLLASTPYIVLFTWSFFVWTEVSWTGQRTLAHAVQFRWDRMRWGEVRWDEMRWDGMRWDGMRWDEMRWDEVRWDVVKWDEVRWDEVRWGEVRRDEMRWDDVRWGEMRCGEVRWDEVRWDEMRWDRLVRSERSYAVQTRLDLTSSDFIVHAVCLGKGFIAIILLDRQPLCTLQPKTTRRYQDRTAEPL